MHAEVGLRRVEDQPAVADVGALPAEAVADERAQRLRLARVEHRVHASDHGRLLRAVDSQQTRCPRSRAPRQRSSDKVRTCTMPNAPTDSVRSLTVVYEQTPHEWYVDAKAAVARTSSTRASGLRSPTARWRPSRRRT